MASKSSARAELPHVDEVLAQLESAGSRANVEGMARYGIVTEDIVYGVSVGALRQYAKQLGKSHDLAGALWQAGVYEARMLAAFVEEPAAVTPSQMDRWARDFDNWAICDTCCFHLFDKTPYAWTKVERWARRRDELVKRSSFALLASLSVHDKEADDDAFLRGLTLVEREGSDGRNFVKKAVSWALRSVGKRNQALHEAALQVATRMAASDDVATRWVGKDATRDLHSAATTRRLGKRTSATKKAGKKKAAKKSAVKKRPS